MPEGTMAPRHTRWTVTTLVSASIIAMALICMLIWKGNYTRSLDHFGSSKHVDRATVFLEKYVFLFAIYVFGVGSIYLQAHYFISDVQCFHVLLEQ